MTYTEKVEATRYVEPPTIPVGVTVDEYRRSRKVSPAKVTIIFGLLLQTVAAGRAVQYYKRNPNG